VLCIGLDIPVVAGSLVVEGQDERSHMGYHRRRQLLQRISICRVKRVWYTNLECSLHSPFWQDGKGMLQAFCWYNAGGSIEGKVVKQWWGQIVE